MKEQQTAFQIHGKDNVATALTEISPGRVLLLGDASQTELEAIGNIPQGYKIALCEIEPGEKIVKYGVSIGHAISHISTGSLVHLQVMCSDYDERSSHLDAKTGVPKDTKYE